MKTSRNKENQQLRLLTRGDATELSKFKKRFRLSKADRELVSRSDNSDGFFDNLITVEELAVIFRVSPQTIRNWVALGKIPYIQIGRRSLFRLRSLQEWLIQKEESQWQ